MTTQCSQPEHGIPCQGRDELYRHSSVCRQNILFHVRAGMSFIDVLVFADMGINKVFHVRAVINFIESPVLVDKKPIKSPSG